MSSIAQPKRRISLRSVGEILTDHTGNFYELRGDELRELGKLLVDRRGRVFEIADVEPPTIATEAPIVAKQSIIFKLLNWFSRMFLGNKTCPQNEQYPWIGSVPSAVADGSNQVSQESVEHRMLIITHPLPRTVLTRSKCDSDP